MTVNDAYSAERTSLLSELSRLDPADQVLLALFYVERLSLEEIARVLGDEEDEVAARFYLAHEAAGATRADAIAGCGSELQVA